MIRWVWYVVAGIVGVVGLMTVIGWLLPVGHVASRSGVVARMPAEVFARVVDVADYPTWWSDVSRVEVLPPVDGRPRYREHMSSGAVVFETVEALAPTRFVSRIADPDQPFGGTWTFELAPDGDGTRVTITERGEVYNPFFRFLSRFVFSQTSTIERCLAALSHAPARS